MCVRIVCAQAMRWVYLHTVSLQAMACGDLAAQDSPLT